MGHNEVNLVITLSSLFTDSSGAVLSPYVFNPHLSDLLVPNLYNFLRTLKISYSCGWFPINQIFYPYDNPYKLKLFSNSPSVPPIHVDVLNVLSSFLLPEWTANHQCCPRSWNRVLQVLKYYSRHQFTMFSYFRLFYRIHRLREFCANQIVIVSFIKQYVLVSFYRSAVIFFRTTPEGLLCISLRTVCYQPCLFYSSLLTHQPILQSAHRGPRKTTKICIGIVHLLKGIYDLVVRIRQLV